MFSSVPDFEVLEPTRTKLSNGDSVSGKERLLGPEAGQLFPP
jgi:hypothetical protein